MCVCVSVCLPFSGSIKRLYNTLITEIDFVVFSQFTQLPTAWHALRDCEYMASLNYTIIHVVNVIDFAPVQQLHVQSTTGHSPSLFVIIHSWY